jgi:Domain of unknown function (DUF4157)
MAHCDTTAMLVPGLLRWFAMSYGHRHRPPGAASQPTAPGSSSAGSIGKHALTSALTPVQRHAAVPRGTGEVGAAEVHAASARGIAAPATALPHAERIQASFGAGHDVGPIQAHVGGDSAAAMGATAYASGNHVVFDREPDLHTAAHEAAHVVQQARGVELSDGVGQAGDRDERHADAVADRVVAGRSAADLLGPPVGGAAPRGGGAVQRSPEKPTKEQTKNFCSGGDWLHCGKGASDRPQLVVGVRRSDKDNAPHMAQAGLSDGKGHILVETPTGATGSPYVHFYLIRGDGTPIRGGSGLLYVSSKEKEQEVEIDRSAADQVGADTRAIVVGDGIDEYPKTKDPHHPVRVTEVARIGKRVDARIDLGTAEGVSGIYKARLKFGGSDGIPDVEYDARKLTGQDGNSYADFEIDDKDAGQRIGNLQDSVKRGAAFATLIIESNDKDK